jgi:hypothetical protein
MVKPLVYGYLPDQPYLIVLIPDSPSLRHPFCPCIPPRRSSIDVLLVRLAIPSPFWLQLNAFCVRHRQDSVEDWWCGYEPGRQCCWGGIDLTRVCYRVLLHVQRANDAYLSPQTGQLDVYRDALERLNATIAFKSSQIDSEETVCSSFFPI